jgi:hypothetical protein
MDNLNRKELFDKVDNIITWKLDALRNRIWKEAKDVPEHELEEFINNLRISAVFCSDTETYLELQSKLGEMLTKLSSGRDINSNMRTADIMKKLGIR